VTDKELQKQKRREYYLRRKEYYLAQNKVWRDNNKEHRAEHAAKKHRERKQNSPELYLWKYAKARAKSEGMDFDLEVTDIVIPEVCPYFKTPFIMGDKQLAASLDRIDSSGGYTKDNVRVISYKANRMKNNATEQELISFAKGVLEVHSKGVCCDADPM
jgi:hypothetical protein